MSLLSRKYPWSKWQKHLVLARDPALREFLPDTAVLKEETLLDFLSRYPVVFVKPSCGGGGRGVVKISVLEEGQTEIQTTETRTVAELPQVYRTVMGYLRQKEYIVQQGVSLIRIDERPIDFRTLLLRPGKTWRYMGVMGKLAVRDQIVTNHCRGGSSLTFSGALKESKEMQEEGILELEKRLEQLSLQIAAAMQRRFPLVAELGLDIGIDENMKLWLIEANTRPQYKLFRDHEDPMLYNRIGAIIKTVRLPLS